MAEQQRRELPTADFTDWRALAGRLAGLASVASDAAHRFNNLRGVIDGTLELLAADPTSTLTAQRLERLREAAARAQALAEGMVLLARAQSGGDVSFDLGAWLVAARVWLKPLLGSGTTLAIEPPPAPVLFLGDPVFLRAALTALVLNAAAAVGSAGHVSVRLERRKAEGRGMIVLSVADDGPGMVPAVAARAREPFFTTRPEAAGLGLSVVQACASRYGGQLEISSGPGLGTTVSLWLAERPAVSLP